MPELQAKSSGHSTKSDKLCGYTGSDAMNVVFVFSSGLIENKCLKSQFFTSYFPRENSISQKAVLQLCLVILHAICFQFISWVHMAGAMRVMFLAQETTVHIASYHLACLVLRWVTCLQIFPHTLCQQFELSPILFHFVLFPISIPGFITCHKFAQLTTNDNNLTTNITRSTPKNEAN